MLPEGQPPSVAVNPLARKCGFGAPLLGRGVGKAKNHDLLRFMRTARALQDDGLGRVCGRDRCWPAQLHDTHLHLYGWRVDRDCGIRCPIFRLLSVDSGTPWIWVVMLAPLGFVLAELRYRADERRWPCRENRVMAVDPELTA
jgi:hypothetical protein